MVESVAQDGYLVVTWANWHYQDFVHTWVTHIKECGVTGYLVGAMDDKLMQVRHTGKFAPVRSSQGRSDNLL
eukprot:1141838-Pelagomonas_calceolata.AAC.3